MWYKLLLWSEIPFYTVIMGQECTRKQVCFGKHRQGGNYFPWKKNATLMLSAKAFSFAVEYPRASMSLQLKKSGHSTRRENMATKRWRKSYHRGTFQKKNTKALCLENLLIPSRDSFTLEHVSYSEHSGNIFGIIDSLSFQISTYLYFNELGWRHFHTAHRATWSCAGYVGTAMPH